MNVKGVTHGPGPMFASLKVGGRQRKRGRSCYLLSIWTDYLHNLKVAKNGYMEKWLFLVLLYTKFSRLNA